MRQFTAVLSFLFMWLFVSVICAFVLALLFPSDGVLRIGFASGDWKTWPGTVLGILCGVHSYKAALNPK